jgi:hypothetical protein
MVGTLPAAAGHVKRKLRRSGWRLSRSGHTPGWAAQGHRTGSPTGRSSNRGSYVHSYGRASAGAAAGWGAVAQERGPMPRCPPCSPITRCCRADEARVKGGSEERAVHRPLGAPREAWPRRLGGRVRRRAEFLSSRWLGGTLLFNEALQEIVWVRGRTWVVPKGVPSFVRRGWGGRKLAGLPESRLSREAQPLVPLPLLPLTPVQTPLQRGGN